MTRTASPPLSLAGSDAVKASSGGNPWDSTITVTATDITLSLCTLAASVGGLLFSMISPFAVFFDLLDLAVATAAVPVAFLIARLHRGGDLTMPVLLAVTSLAAGPIGALGCAYLASRLRRERPMPSRLRSWYAYIAGIVARERIVHLHEDLSSGRLPHDPLAEVPRFRPILHGGSTDDQQRVLGVLGRRYHADFRLVLRDALRNKNSFIRAQAAAVATRLDAQEKNAVWSSGPVAETPDSA
jgi:hypothetical protein